MTDRRTRPTRSSQVHRRSEAGRRRPVAALAALVVVAGTAIAAMSWAFGAAAPGPSSTTPSSTGSTSPIGAAGPATSFEGAPSPSFPEPGSPNPTVSSAVAGRFGLGLLIADEGNGRLIIVNDVGRILWQFPAAGSLPPGQHFAADDAFIAPDGKTIVANDEAHEVIDRIDIVTRKVIWQYGHYGRAGAARGYLHTPDDAYPLPNGNVTVADIDNCRILEISPAKSIVRQLGQTGSCVHRPPFNFNHPNGDTPLPDGGLLVTEIGGSRVVRLSAAGRVIFDIHVPVAYPSDAQLDPAGNVLIADYSNPGAILRVSPRGKVLWRYGPISGSGRLDHPSLAILLADGTIALNDDFRDQVIVIDPPTRRIVWRYGHIDRASTAGGYLSIPDGIGVIPVGTVL
jgi:hypothetical protein